MILCPGQSHQKKNAPGAADIWWKKERKSSVPTLHAAIHAEPIPESEEMEHLAVKTICSIFFGDGFEYLCPGLIRDNYSYS